MVTQSSLWMRFCLGYTVSCSVLNTVCRPCGDTGPMILTCWRSSISRALSDTHADSERRTPAPRRYRSGTRSAGLLMSSDLPCGSRSSRGELSENDSWPSSLNAIMVKSTQAVIGAAAVGLCLGFLRAHIPDHDAQHADQQAQCPVSLCGNSWRAETSDYGGLFVLRLQDQVAELARGARAAGKIAAPMHEVAG